MLECFNRVFLAGSVVKNLPASAGDLGSVPGLGRSPGEGNDNPLQYSCLGNPMDRGTTVGHSPWGRKRVGQTLVTKEQQYNSFNRCTHPTPSPLFGGFM